MDALMSWLTDNIGAIEKLGGLWLAVGVVSLLLTIVALPVIVIRLPADYFVRHERLTVAKVSAHPAIVIMVSALKNLVGFSLIVFGAIMLFIPGQGVLTILIGLMLANFPGKYHLEQKLVRRRAVLRTLNRIRERAGRQPLIAPRT